MSNLGLAELNQDHQQLREAGDYSEVEKTKVSIVLSTFYRNNALREAILSCLDQRTVDGEPFEILIVDNSPERTAEPVVDAMDAGGVPLRYFHEPRPGISHARNRCIAEARGDFIAMIDDDEVAAPDWLFNLMRTQSTFDADVVFGPVHPRFDSPPPEDGDFLTAFYTYSLPLTTGSKVGVRATNNALVRRSAISDLGKPFDTELGLTGGEDTLFFSKLKANDARFIWSAEAIVKETIPTDRLNRSKIWHRAFQRGQCRASTPMLLPKPRPAETLFWMMVGAGQIVVLAPIIALLWLPDRQRALYCAWKLVSGVGKIFWMKRFRQQVYGAAAGPDETVGKTADMDTAGDATSDDEEQLVKQRQRRSVIASIC
jgi:glycosyltransferase involved in cell wall biosynthesis